MLGAPAELARELTAEADRIKACPEAPHVRCSARTRAGAAGRCTRASIAPATGSPGWSFGMWGWNWWRPSRSERLACRIAASASDGDIIVMHDGHHENPRADRARTVKATAN